MLLVKTLTDARPLALRDPQPSELDSWSTFLVDYVRHVASHPALSDVKSGHVTGCDVDLTTPAESIASPKDYGAFLAFSAVAFCARIRVHRSARQELRPL